MQCSEWQKKILLAFFPLHTTKFPRIRDFKEFEEFKLPTPEFPHLFYQLLLCTGLPEDGFDPIKEDSISVMREMTRVLKLSRTTVLWQRSWTTHFPDAILVREGQKVEGLGDGFRYQEEPSWIQRLCLCSSYSRQTRQNPQFPAHVPSSIRDSLPHWTIKGDALGETR